LRSPIVSATICPMSSHVLRDPTRLAAFRGVLAIVVVT